RDPELAAALPLLEQFERYAGARSLVETEDREAPCRITLDVRQMMNVFASRNADAVAVEHRSAGTRAECARANFLGGPSSPRLSTTCSDPLLLDRARGRALGQQLVDQGVLLRPHVAHPRLEACAEAFVIRIARRQRLDRDRLLLDAHDNQGNAAAQEVPERRPPVRIYDRDVEHGFELVADGCE